MKSDSKESTFLALFRRGSTDIKGSSTYFCLSTDNPAPCGLFALAKSLAALLACASRGVPARLLWCHGVIVCSDYLLRIRHGKHCQTSPGSFPPFCEESTAWCVFLRKIIAGQRVCSQTKGLSWKILGTRGSEVKCFDVRSEMFVLKTLKS